MCYLKLFLKPLLLLPVLQAGSLHFFQTPLQTVCACRYSCPFSISFWSVHGYIWFKITWTVNSVSSDTCLQFWCERTEQLFNLPISVFWYVKIPILSSRYSRKTNAKFIICVGDFMWPCQCPFNPFWILLKAALRYKITLVNVSLALKSNCFYSCLALFHHLRLITCLKN